MLVNPRKVAPGWLLRWPKEAFQLMSRAWILWMGTAAVLAVASQLLVDMGILRLLFWPLGLFVMLVSTDFARLSDHKFVTGHDIVDTLRTNFHFWIADLKHRWLFAIATISAYLVGSYLASSNHEATAELASTATAHIATLSPSNLVDWLLLPQSPLSDAGMAIFAGCVLSASGYIFPGMSGCLCQKFGDIDRKVILSLAYKAASQNMKPVGTLAVLNILLALLSATVPVVGWLLGVFMPVLCYVAFREVFVDDNGNRKRAPRTVSSSITNTVADAA